MAKIAYLWHWLDDRMISSTKNHARMLLNAYCRRERRLNLRTKFLLIAEDIFQSLMQAFRMEWVAANPSTSTTIHIPNWLTDLLAIIRFGDWLVLQAVGHVIMVYMLPFHSTTLASFAAFSPKVYSYYRENLERVFDHDPGLERLFPSHISVYPAAAFNFGPNVWTYKHKDLLNCPFGWCAIQALGSFDPTKGGQLVLWEAKLVIDFPAGSLILLPSSIITHSNIPVAMGDNRASFTQYAAGGLFRYVDYNYCTEKQLKKNNPNLWKQILEKRVDNWKIGCALISSLDELRN
jgi:hypothetical protein